MPIMPGVHPMEVQHVRSDFPETWLWVRNITRYVSLLSEQNGGSAYTFLLPLFDCVERGRGY